MPEPIQHIVDENLVGMTTGNKSNPLLKEIHDSKHTKLSSLHRPGVTVFSEGQSALGLYVLRAGRAKILISSSEGRVLILRVAEPGELLGMNSVLKNSPYDMTVKTIERSRTDFISRTDFMDLLERSERARVGVSEALSKELTDMFDRAKSLFLPQTAAERLARLLLEWCGHWGVTESEGIRLENNFTQEEMAQMIGASRETVTRLLGEFSRRRIIQLTANTILVRDRNALETIPRT